VVEAEINKEEWYYRLSTCSSVWWFYTLSTNVQYITVSWLPHELLE